MQIPLFKPTFRYYAREYELMCKNCTKNIAQILCIHCECTFYCCEKCRMDNWEIHKYYCAYTEIEIVTIEDFLEFNYKYYTPKFHELTAPVRVKRKELKNIYLEVERKMPKIFIANNFTLFDRVISSIIKDGVIINKDYSGKLIASEYIDLFEYNFVQEELWNYRDSILFKTRKFPTLYKYISCRLYSNKVTPIYGGDEREVWIYMLWQALERDYSLFENTLELDLALLAFDGDKKNLQEAMEMISDLSLREKIIKGFSIISQNKPELM